MKSKIKNLPKMAQHFVKNLLSYDKRKKYDGLVEEIIKDKMGQSKDRSKFNRLQQEQRDLDESYQQSKRNKKEREPND